MNEETKKRIIEKLNKDGCFEPLDCGYVHLWPQTTQGALSADSLRVIADELDRRNVEIKKHYREMRTK